MIQEIIIIEPAKNLKQAEFHLSKDDDDDHLKDDKYEINQMKLDEVQPNFKRNLLNQREILDDILQYDILQKVGEGAFSTVFKVQHKMSKKFYAIKQMDKKLINKVSILQVYSLVEKNGPKGLLRTEHSEKA